MCVTVQVVRGSFVPQNGCLEPHCRHLASPLFCALLVGLEGVEHFAVRVPLLLRAQELEQTGRILDEYREYDHDGETVRPHHVPEVCQFAVGLVCAVQYPHLLENLRSVSGDGGGN